MGQGEMMMGIIIPFPKGDEHGWNGWKRMANVFLGPIYGGPERWIATSEPNPIVVWAGASVPPCYELRA